MPTDLTLEHLDEMEAHARRINGYFLPSQVRPLIAMARKVPKLEAELKAMREIAEIAGPWETARELAQKTAEVIAQAREIAEFKAALRYSSELRIKSAIQFQIQLEGQAREIAELKAQLANSRQHSTIMLNAKNWWRDECQQYKAVAEGLRVELADQAQLLAEARRLIDMFIRCDMACALEGSHCTDPSGHWPDCSLHQARAFLAKLPGGEPQRTTRASLLPEVRKLIEDMLDELEPESNTACEARAMLAKLPADEAKDLK